MATSYPVNRIAQYAGDGKELFEEYPVSSVVVAFGIGLAVGLALVVLNSESESRHYSTAQRLGQRFLDTMSGALPDSMVRACSSR